MGCVRSESYWVPRLQQGGEGGVTLLFEVFWIKFGNWEKGNWEGYIHTEKELHGKSMQNEKHNIYNIYIHFIQ